MPPTVASVPQPSASTPWLSQINPWLKIGLSVVLLGLALVLDRVEPMVAIAIGLLLLLVSVRVPGWVWLYGLVSFGLFAGFTAWLTGDWAEASFSTLRLLAIALPTPILTLTTPPATLIRALDRARLPRVLTLSVMLIWRFCPVMLQEVERIWEANLLRGVDLRWQPRQWFAGLMVPLVFQVVAYADDVAIGLQTRGYDPAAPRSCGQPLRWQYQDTLFTFLALVWLAGIVFLAGWI